MHEVNQKPATEVTMALEVFMTTFRKGDHIINITAAGKIFFFFLQVREDGLLVVRNAKIGKWIADPNKCVKF